MSTDDEDDGHFAPPMFPLTFNLAYRAPPLSPCCVKAAERTYQSWCDEHHASTNAEVLKFYLAQIGEYLPLLRQVRWFQDVIIRIAHAPGLMQGVTIRGECGACQRDYRILVFSASLLAVTLHLNLLPLLLVTENGNRFSVRAPTREDLERLHSALKCYLDGASPRDEDVNRLADLLNLRYEPNGHLDFLTSMVSFGWLFFLAHEIAHHFRGISGARFGGWMTADGRPMPQKRAVRWTTELSADIDGAYLMHEAFRTARFGFHPEAAIGPTDAARMAFGAAMVTLEALGDIEALQTRGRTCDLFHDGEWSRHPPFLYRCRALREYADGFSEKNFGGADLFEHVRILSRLRGTLFEHYDPKTFAE